MTTSPVYLITRNATLAEHLQRHLAPQNVQVLSPEAFTARGSASFPPQTMIIVDREVEATIEQALAQTVQRNRCAERPLGLADHTRFWERHPVAAHAGDLIPPPPCTAQPTANSSRMQRRHRYW